MATFKYTKMQIALEIAGLLLIVGMITFICVQWNHIPKQIPWHYNALGEIDRWGSKSEILIMPIVGILLYIGITVISFFPQIWNIPVRVTDKNEEAVYRCMRNLLILTKIEMVGIFLYLTFYSAIAQPLHIAFLPVLLIVLFGTMIFFIVRTYQIGKKGKG